MSTENPAPATGLKSPEELAREIMEAWCSQSPDDANPLWEIIARAIAEDRLNRVGLDVDGVVSALIDAELNWRTTDDFRSILLAHLRPDPLVAAAIIAIERYDADDSPVIGSDEVLDACRALVKGSGR